MTSSDIIVNKNWQVIKPFHIQVPELDKDSYAHSYTTAKDLQWNRDYNFPDFECYSFTLYERKWALTYNGHGIIWNIFFGTREKDALMFDGIYHGFIGHKDEEGGHKTDIKGYSIKPLEDGNICLQVLPQ